MDANTQQLLQALAIVTHQQNRSEGVLDGATPRKIRMFSWVRVRLLWRPKRKHVIQQCECGAQVVRLKKSSQIS